MSLMNQEYELSPAKIEELNARAKCSQRIITDLNIGESCYLLSLMKAIGDYRNGVINEGELAQLQRELARQLEDYYQLADVHAYAVRIRNRCSPVLTKAEKHGCEICKKLVRIFDGRARSAD